MKVEKRKSLSVNNFEIYAKNGNVIDFGISLEIDKFVVNLTAVQAMTLNSILNTCVNQMKERFGIL